MRAERTVSLASRSNRGMSCPSVFLVDGLAGDAELVGDLLPRPPLIAGVADLNGFELFGKPAQGGDGA